MGGFDDIYMVLLPLLSYFIL